MSQIKQKGRNAAERGTRRLLLATCVPDAPFIARERRRTHFAVVLLAARRLDH